MPAAHRRSLPAASSWLALALVAVTLGVGILLPVYTDEVAWRWQERAAIDGIDFPIFPNCGPNTFLQPPLFMWPARWWSATTNLAFPTPLAVRLAGLACFALIVGLFALVGSRLGRSTMEKENFRLLGVSLLGFGILPMGLIISRPEQPLLLATLVALLAVFGRGQREIGYRGQAGAMAIIVAAAAVAMSYHLKGVVLAPLFLTCAWFATTDRKLRTVGLAVLALLVVAATPYWTERFRCPADPQLAAMLARENLFAAGQRPSAAMLLKIVPQAYMDLALPSLRHMADWLPMNALGERTAFAWAAALRTAWLAGWFVLATCLLAAGLRWRRERSVDRYAVVAATMFATIGGWGVLQINQNAYEAAFVLPLLVLALLFGLRSLPRPPAALAGAARVSAGLATTSLALLVATYGGTLARATSTDGYSDLQPFSIATRAAAGLDERIVMLARQCGLRPDQRPERLLLDDLTYFPFMTSRMPLHRLGVLHVWNGSIVDPGAFLKAHDSDGALLRCRYLPPELRSLAVADGEICCLSKTAILWR